MTRKTWQGYTADEIRKIVAMWPTHTVSEICDELVRSKTSVYYIVSQIRKAGQPMPKKAPVDLVKITVAELLINK